MKLRLLTYLSLSLLPLSLCGQSVVESPFNHLPLVEDSVSNDYSFWVSAHFYGGEGNKSGYPASTILGNISMLNNSAERFVVCNGDMFKDVQNDIPTFQKSFFQFLRKPLFNAVGNHDISGNVYQENFGDTYSSFVYHNDLYILLDAELENSSIAGEQLEWFLKTLKTARKGNPIFIFSHRPIWAEDHPVLGNVFPDNTKALTGSNFPSAIEPALKTQQASNAIYWFSGSLGKAPASFFYYEEEGTEIHYIQTAIRDIKRDALLSVSVSDEQVVFKTVSLTGQKLEPLEHYDLEFWMQDRPTEEFNTRLIPYYVRLMATHRYFWYGVLYTLGGVFALAFLTRWRRKRRSR
jgi:hypothetical protein